MNESPPPLPVAQPHSWWEDVQGLLIGPLFVALAVVLFQQAGLLTGGTTGLAFLLHYQTHWPLGAWLFVVNLPFYVLGWRVLGLAFTIKTFAAVALLAAYTEALPHVLHIASVNTVFAAVMAGLLAGTGILVLIRHGASLGGAGIVAIYLQKRRGWRAGHVQMGVDALVLSLAWWVTTPGQVLLSLLGAAALNLVIAVNHKAGRYWGT